MGRETRAQAADLREQAGALGGQPGPEELREWVSIAQIADRLLGLRKVIRIKAPEQSAVDQHQSVEVLVAGAAAEVPGGVGESQGCAERVPTEDHATALGPGSLQHRVSVSEGDAHPPSAGERVLAGVKELEVVGRRPAVRDPPEVVVEHALEADLPG